MTISVFVGSTKPEKVSAVLIAFQTKFQYDVEVIPCDVPSGIRDQPVGFEETFQGAQNRKDRAKEIAKRSEKDPVKVYCVGIENGLIPLRDLKICLDEGVVVVERLYTGLWTMSKSTSLEIPLEIEPEWSDDQIVRQYHDKLWTKVHQKGKDWYLEMTMGIVGRQEALMMAVQSAFGQLLYRESHAKLHPNNE